MTRRKSDAWSDRPRNVRTRAFVEHYGNARIKKPVVVMKRLVRKAIRDVRGLDVAPPLVPEEFFDYFRIQTLTLDVNSASAAQLVKQGNDFSIVVRSGPSPGRRNFSVFHELAHVYFENAIRERRSRFTQLELKELQVTRSDEERLCDFAATEFLFPRELFVAELSGFEGTWLEVLRLADKFGASFEATARRVNETWSGDVWIQKWAQESGELIPSDLCCTGRFRRLRGAFGTRPMPEILSAARSRVVTERSLPLPALRGEGEVVVSARPWHRDGALSVFTLRTLPHNAN